VNTRRRGPLPRVVLAPVNEHLSGPAPDGDDVDHLFGPANRELAGDVAHERLGLVVPLSAAQRDVHADALAGLAPIPANSGQVTTRYRLNRYGDRQLNNALHTVVQSRIQHQPATRDYVARRTAEGKTGPEIKRCLVRYVARDLYRLLETRPQLLDEA
jgi:Transposase IS116/IS110/IS902 family